MQYKVVGEFFSKEKGQLNEKKKIEPYRSLLKKNNKIIMSVFHFGFLSSLIIFCFFKSSIIFIVILLLLL